MILATPLRRRAAALMAVSALLLAACGGGDSSASTERDPVDIADDLAAAVDGAEVTRADFDAEVATLVDNEALVASLEGSGVDLVDDDGSPSATAESVWLGTVVQQAVVDAEVAQRGLEVTDERRATARDTLVQRFGGEDVLAAWPDEFVTLLTDRAARVEALRADVVGPAPTEEEQRAYYDDNLDAIKASCTSGFGVSHVLVDTEAEAQAVVDRVAAGEDFSDVAREVSTDPGSAPDGGYLGCFVEGTFDPDFEAAVTAATPGTPTAPVQTQFGWHVILVGTDDPTTFEAMQPQIARGLESQADSDAAAEFASLIEAADVVVNPVYGTWVVDPAQGGRVVPPGEPLPDATAPAPSDGAAPSG